MKKLASIILATAMTASLASAGGGGEGGGGSIIDQLNELGYGTFSGKLQLLSMYRDVETDSNSSTTLGIQLDYLSPEKEGWIFGASYIGAGVLDSMDYDDVANPGETLVANGRNNVLNEAYISYNLAKMDLTNTTVTIGRRVNNNEVFRADAYRHKARSIEAFQAESKDIENLRIAGGHAFRMSRWQSTGDLWQFNNFGDAFNTADDTAGVTWAETCYTGIDNLEIAAFDAIAWDAVNLMGMRVRYDIGEEKKTSILAYLRTERDIGDLPAHESNAFGLSVVQELEEVTLEGGFFSIGGGDLLFEETTTGINHALGAAMMIYAGQFNGGADTLYLKATTTLEKTGTALYGIYSFTSHDKGKSDMRNGHELNLVASQPIPKIDNLSITLKGAIGYVNGINGDPDTLGTGARVYMTYTF